MGGGGILPTEINFSPGLILHGGIYYKIFINLMEMRNLLKFQNVDLTPLKFSYKEIPQAKFKRYVSLP